MKTLRNLALAGTLAIAAALSSGAANAGATSYGRVALEIGTPSATESSIAPAFHYGPHHGRRLCHVPFFRLVQWFGFWQARAIKHRCYNYYSYYNYYSF